MATIKTEFKNDLTNKLGRSGCPYSHKLQSVIPGVPLAPNSIQIKNLPQGLKFDSQTNTISGVIEDFNKWHKCKDYILKEIADKPNDEVVFPDCYESLDNLVPLTAGYLKQLKSLHYSGKNHGMFGDLAYVADGHKITQELTIIINNSEEKVEMTLDIARSPKKFITDYGKNNELIGKDKKPCSPEEYIDFLTSEGHPPSAGCS